MLLLPQAVTLDNVNVTALELLMQLQEMQIMLDLSGFPLAAIYLGHAIEAVSDSFSEAPYGDRRGH